MQQTIRLYKNEEFIRYTVENSSSETIPLIFKVLTREQSPEGVEKNEDTKDVTIFPPQMLLKSGQKKAVRVTYKGNRNFGKEKAFRVIAQQVPVNLKSEEKNTGIKMLLKFQNALYVQNKSHQSKVFVESFELIDDKLKVVISNTGKVHQYLYNVQLKFKKGNKQVLLDKENLKKLEGQNILAESKRIYVFEKIKELTAEFIGTITFD